jgi:Tfp pilus assembly protein PilF
LGRLDDAERAFEKSLEKDDRFALPWVALSSTYLRKKKLDQAIEAAEKAQVLAPRLWPAVAAAARAYAHKSQMDFAIQEYRRAVAMAPGKPYLLSELALTYHASGMDSDAERYARAALKLDPDVVPALILLAERALEANRGARALEFAKRATAVEPRDVSAWLARGDAEQILDEPNAAKEAWEKALRLWRETRQRGAPRERLSEVQAALDDDRLPDPRSGVEPNASHGGGESDPSAQPPARSAPEARSKPKARSKPQPRSKPAAKPAPRSRPDPSNLDF